MKKLTKNKIESKQRNIEIELARILEEEQKLQARKLKLRQDYFNLEEKKQNLERPKSETSTLEKNLPKAESIQAVQKELKQETLTKMRQLKF